MTPRLALLLAGGLLLTAAAGSPRRALAWPADSTVNVPVCTAAGPQLHPVLLSDSQARSTVLWQDARSGNGDVYAQRLDEYGSPLWTPDGVAVCGEAHEQALPAAVPSGSGVIAVWQDGRGGDWDVYAQRLDATGGAQWAADGVALCTAPDAQHSLVAVGDGADGAIVAWLDLRNGTDVHVYAQRVGAGGVPQWSADGVGVCVTPGARRELAIVSDGAGGAIVTWRDSLSACFAQRVGPGGGTSWAAGGVQVVPPSVDRGLAVLGDGQGGLFVAWEGLNPTGFFTDIFAQRVDRFGALLWPPGGVLVGGAQLFQGQPTMVSDGAGGVVVAWADGRGFHYQQVFAQGLYGNGAVRWTVNGMPVSPLDEGPLRPASAPDGGGGIIVVWQDARHANPDLYMQRLGSTGTPLWSFPTGVAVCTADSAQLEQRVAPDGVGGAIVAWTDGRSPATGPDIYAQRVFASGVLDTTGRRVDVEPRAAGGLWLGRALPNPARGPVVIPFALPRAADVSLALFDQQGRRVRGLLVGSRPAGRGEAGWDGCDEQGRLVPAGLYFYRLTAERRTLTGRLISVR